MATKKKPVPKKPIPKKPVPKKPKPLPTPPDWVSGSKKPGGTYQKLVTGGGRVRPDFGKKKGPGIPYSTKAAKVPTPPKPKPKPKNPGPLPPKRLAAATTYRATTPTMPAPSWKRFVNKDTPDFKANAIRKRLGG